MCGLSSADDVLVSLLCKNGFSLWVEILDLNASKHKSGIFNTTGLI